MKALIYWRKNLLKSVGGPTGYLYSVNNELEKKNIKDIEFIVKEDSKVKKVFNKLPKLFKNIYYKIKFYKNRNKILKDVFFDKINRKAVVNLDQYDIVHFHSAASMYMAKDSLKDYKGKVLYTTHTPKATFKEIIEDNTPKKDYEKHKTQYDKLEILDQYAFNRADYIIFPTEESEECYYNTWEKYDEIKKKNIDKYKYIPSGIVPIKINDNSSEVRKRYNIPDNAFVISYVGRHNEVKGYDKLKEIGKKVLEKFDDCYFIIAGKEEPIKGIDNSRWIEVGWTNNPYEIINASDLFILPNKETYFDLVLLEVMSIGKPVLLTYTGGNKFFKKFEDTGLFFYDYNDIPQAVSIIKDIKNMDCIKLGNKNKKIFEENFTITKFVEQYTNLLQTIYKN